jgi:hypothetical protein
VLRTLEDQIVDTRTPSDYVLDKRGFNVALSDNAMPVKSSRRSGPDRPIEFIEHRHKIFDRRFGTRPSGPKAHSARIVLRKPAMHFRVISVHARNGTHTPRIPPSDCRCQFFLVPILKL